MTVATTKYQDYNDDVFWQMVRKLTKPNFFIVGAPKCGTTALYEYLRVHPDIFMPPNVKEPHYFASEFQTLGMQIFRSLDAYLELFVDASDKKRIGEASVLYLYSDIAAQAIWEFDPNARLIAMLRNPIDMMYSLFYQERYSGNEVLTSFDEAVALESDRKAGLHVPPRSVAKKLYYREIGRYSVQLERYYNRFGRDQVHVIIFDDFVHDSQKIYRETLEFLSVDPDYQVDFVVHNANKVPRSHALNRLRYYPPRWYRPIQSTIRKVLSASARARIRTTIRKFNTTNTSRPPMNPATRRQLQIEFRSEIEQLSALLDRDLTHWCE